MPDPDDPFATAREYVAVRPTTDSLAPTHATNALRSLHGGGMWLVGHLRPSG